MGPETLYGAVASVMQVLAWLWIVLAGLIALVIVATVVRSRRSSWVREGEVLPPARVTTPVADHGSKVA